MRFMHGRIGIDAGVALSRLNQARDMLRRSETAMGYAVEAVSRAIVSFVDSSSFGALCGKYQSFQWPSRAKRDRRLHRAVQRNGLNSDLTLTYQLHLRAEGCLLCGRIGRDQAFAAAMFSSQTKYRRP